jgi:hypothetical protein
MRSIDLAAVSAVALLASAGAALASGLPTLTVNTLANANPGPTSASDSQSSTTDPALISLSHDTDVSGLSFAGSFAQASYGALHAYAEAFDSVSPGGVYELGEAQATADASYAEFFSAPLVDKADALTIAINGVTSPQPQFGPGPSAVVIWRLEDITARDNIFTGGWALGDPLSVFNVPYVIPAGHETRLYVDLFVFAYDGSLSKPGVVYADYKDTVQTYIDSTDGGGPVIGLSGHDYSSPTLDGGVPEPAAWALMILGFGALGGLARQRRAGPAAA